MASSELLPKIDLETIADNQLRVYPMGFIPDIKRQLLDSAEQRRLRQMQSLSEIGQELNDAVNRLNNDSGGDEISQFLEKIRLLDEFVKDGQSAYEQEKDFITHVLRTDEELAVIFAKISRNPGSFEEISRTVTEEGAGRFHETWVVSVEGYGHASVAEHAIIHMAVENAPSLDGDELTDNRLASFTEFSARFKGRQGVGYYTPESVMEDSQLSRRWHEVHQGLFGVHDDLMAKGQVYISTDEAKQKHSNRRVVTKTVADQFKNLMPASRFTSIGITMNSREAENTIRKMLSSPYPSVQRLGALFKEQSLKVAPTLVKYADRSEYMVATHRGIAGLVEDQRYQGYIPPVEEEGKLVDLIEFDKIADEKFIAAALYNDPKVGSYKELLNKLSGFSLSQKRGIIENLLGKLGRWDVPIRALEMPGDYIVEFPGMTYGDWREYKRHRMQSYQVKDLDVRWGFMIPPLAREMDESTDSQFHGCVEAIKIALGEVEKLFTQVSRVDPYAAHYAVTRLHYRPAIAKFNIRENYHLIDLRTGPTAHPFIRRLMWPLFDEIKKVQPLLMDYLRLKLEKIERPSRDFPWSL